MVLPLAIIIAVFSHPRRWVACFRNPPEQRLESTTHIQTQECVLFFSLASTASICTSMCWHHVPCGNTNNT
jgi:hypothetical protein